MTERRTIPECNTTHYSVRRTATDNAERFYQVGTPPYQRLLKRNAQIFSIWAARGAFSSQKIGRTRYFPRAVYELLVDIVRNKHAAQLLGVTTTTIARLKQQGVLHRIHIPYTSTTFVSYEQLCDPKIVEIIEKRKIKSHNVEYWLENNKRYSTLGLLEYQMFYERIFHRFGNSEVFCILNILNISESFLQNILLEAASKLDEEDKKRYIDILEKQMERYNHGKRKVSTECISAMQEFVHKSRAIYLQLLYEPRYQ